MKAILPWAVCLLLALLPANPAFAGRRKKAVEHHDTVIANVAPDSITIDQDKVPKSFKLTPFTEVTLRGQKASLADLKPGMLVSVTLGTDPTTASRIAAGDPPVHNERPKPKVRKLMR